MEYYGNTYGPTLTFSNTRTQKFAHEASQLSEFIAHAYNKTYEIIHFDTKIKPYCRFTFLAQRMFTERQPLK